jgi:PEP-CTERM motif
MSSFQRRVFIRIRGIILTSVLALGSVSSARADIIMDQIGPNPTFVQGMTAHTSQIFEAGLATFNIAVIDNFSITGGAKTLTEVDAAVVGFGGFTAASYAAITAWNVEIYSSVAAAAGNLTGNVAAFSVAPGAVTVTKPFGTDALSALAAVPINVTLGNGTYYVAVTPVLNFGSSQATIGVYESTFAGTPSDSNAFQVNPAGGFGFPGNQTALNVNAAYRIIGTAAVPEPSVTVLASAGLAGVFFARRWKSRKATV